MRKALQRILFPFEYISPATMEVDEAIPQSQPLPGMIPNSAGGYTWKVDDMNRLRRFLCLGSEGGTYYIKEKELGIENAQCVMRLIEASKGEDLVNEVVSFSVEGRAAKQNPILFVLAMCARQDKDPKVKRLAYEKLPEVCRIPTHLFTFVGYCEQLSSGSGTGWGRAHRKAIGGWYLRFRDNPYKLAMHVTKYKNRNGWEHRDLLRLAHPKPDSENVATVMKYVIKGLDVAKQEFLKDDSSEELKKVFEFLSAVEEVKKCKDESDVVQLVARYRLVREHIPTNFLNSVGVWRSLLNGMPMTALIRNLGKMTSIELLAEGSEEGKKVAGKLQEVESLKAAKIHPFNVLVALNTYAAGHGDKGKLTWKPNLHIQNALDEAYYKSFKFVEPTGKRFCLALDISGSMGCGTVNGSSIVPRDAAAAMCMVTARTEPVCEIVGFSTKLIPLNINAEMKLPEVIKATSHLPFGGTDAAQPMIWAQQNNKLFDVFIVYTDCETWAGTPHPSVALQDYRRHSGIWDAKLIVCAFTSNGFTIADPEDPGMLDMAGFDSNGPEIMRNFVLNMI